MSIVASEENPNGVQARLIARFSYTMDQDEDEMQSRAREMADLAPETTLKLINIGCDLPPGSLNYATQTRSTP